MKRSAIAFALSIGLFACGGGGAGQSTVPTSQEAEVDLSAVKDEACACKDRDCGLVVREKFGTTFRKYKDAKADDAAVKRIFELSKGISGCLVAAGLTRDEVVSILK